MIEKKWKDLMTKLESCRSMLTRYHDLMSVFAEMDDCLGEMTQTEVSLCMHNLAHTDIFNFIGGLAVSE